LLGSDVPFFLWGGAAVGIGRGEELYPLPDLPRLRGVIVAPGIHVSTPEAYRDLSATLLPADVPAKLAAFQDSVRNPLTGPAANDFEAPVFARHPALARIKERLVKAGARPALMSGSGSSIFGIFHRKETGARVVQSLSGGDIHPVFLLTGAAYRRDWLRRLKPHIKGELWPPRSRYAR
jgi:4-diphosphocytidyl-2-C-methyl-D-erythritol kinase